MTTLGRVNIVYSALGIKKMNDDIKGSEKLMAGAALAMAASVAAISVAVVKIGIPFEQMTLDAGAAMRATEGEFKKMVAAAREAGATTEHTATAAASALKALGKAGLNASEAISSLGTVMNFKTAIGSLQSLEKATSNVVGSTIAMGLEMKDMAHVTDLFITVANTSLTDAALMGQSFEKVAGIANIYEMSVEDLTATLGVMANANIKGSIAGRQLKNAFANTSLAAAELGIENKGLIPTIRGVAEAGWGADKIMGIYGRIAMPAVVAILAKVSGTGKGSFAYFQNEMSHASDGMGAAAEQAEKMRASVGNQFAIVQSQIEDAALSIFDDWKPAMLEGIKSTQDFLTENKRAITEVGDVLLPVFKAIGPVLGAVSAIGVQVFGLLNSVFVEFTDDTMLGLIEIEHGAKLAWAGMKTVFGVVMGEMLKIFAAFTTGAATAFKAIGGFDIAGPLDRASMALKVAAKDTGVLTGAFKKANEERKAAIEIHKEKMFQIALEHQGYKDTTDASRKSSEAILADIRKNGAAYQGYSQKNIDNLSKVAEAELAALDKRLEIAEEFYKKTGILSDELRAKKMADIDAAVTRFRLGKSDEVQITKWKDDEIAKLDGKRTGVVEKQLKKERRAFERADKKRIKEAERTASRLLKEEEKFQNSISKFNLDAIKKNEKLLGESQKVFEEFIKKELDIKEISNASKEVLDNVYYDTLQTVRKGDVESFTFAMSDIMAAKFKSVESFKEIDGLYSVYLAEQELKNRDIRLEFYSQAGNWSKEYHQEELVRIDKHSAKLAAAGVSDVDVERQKTDAILALDIKKLESSNSFFAGVRLAAIQSSQDMMTWADAGQSAFNTIQSSLEQGFGDAFKSLMEGPDTSELEAQLEGLQGEYESLGASIVDVNKQIVDTELATQDAIRNSRRATMTEFELFQDDKLKFTETVANAEKAILEENFQLAQNLFVEAQGIAGTMARVVKDETAVAVAEIAGQFDGLRINFDDLEVSVMDFGKASETALGKSGNIFKSITAGAKNFEKDIKKINIAAAFGDVNKAKAAAANIIKNYDAIFKAGQSSIQDLMGEWGDYQKKVEDVNKEILGINESTEDKIRNLRRATMDDQEQWNDQRLEFDQNYAEATRELEEGNFEFASELFEKSIGLAEKLATDSVGTLEGNTDIAISLMEQASAGATSALTSYQSAIGDSMTSVEGAISSTVNALGTVTTTMDGLSVSGVEIVGTLEENTGLAIGLMEEAGIGATDALKLEQEALSANMDKIGGEIEGVSNKIGEESDKIRLDWSGLWSGMVETVGIELGNIAAKWAAAKVAQGAVAGADWLINQFTSAEDGAFDVGQTGPGQPIAALGGGIPILAHAGESILPKEFTDQVKSGIGFDDFKANLRNYFGLGEGEADSIWNQASEYKGAGASLYKAWQAFDEGNELGGVVEAMNAMSDAFKTYGTQNASSVATSIGQGLGEGAGALSSGIGAYQAFQSEDYLTGVTQSLQAVQAAISLAQTVSGTTVGIGAGAVLGTVGAAASGAGIGLAAWNVLNSFAGIEAGDKAPAQVGAAVGGAAIGSMFGGYVGTIMGAIIGGVSGAGISVATENEFDLADVDSWINANRTVSGGKISTLPPSVDPTWFGVAQQKYYDHLNVQALAVNQLTDTISGELTAADAKKFQSSIDSVISGINIQSGGNYNRNRADQMVLGVGNYYWNETVDALNSVVSGTDGLSQGRKSEILSLISGTRPGYIMDVSKQYQSTEEAQQEWWYGGGKEAYYAANPQREVGSGAATGGIVQKEDGALNVSVGEGIIPIKGMEWVEEVGSAILKTGVFGGTEARFDAPGMGTPAGSAGDIFSGDARNALMSELLLNDQVSRQGQTNELLREQVAEQKRSNDILNRIANLIESGDEEGARLLKGILSKPDGVTRAMLNPLFTAADITNRGKRNFFSGVGI